MPKIHKKELVALYRSNDIKQVWQSGQSLSVIDHPVHGHISPNQYRAMYHNKPCPFCGQKMVHGQIHYSTNSKADAIARGYQYQDENGSDVINQAGSTYFHTHYVTIDHKLNKARCPEHMFEYDNLQVICWKCNRKKGDNNAFELQHTFEYLNDLADETLKRYPTL
jgi:hypothetical protein